MVKGSLAKLGITFLMKQATDDQTRLTGQFRRDVLEFRLFSSDPWQWYYEAHINHTSTAVETHWWQLQVLQCRHLKNFSCFTGLKNFGQLFRISNRITQEVLLVLLYFSLVPLFQQFYTEDCQVLPILIMALQIMACCLTAPSHYLIQCWLIINGVLWHLPKQKFYRCSRYQFVNWFYN